ncbi:hypothetical protein ASE66_18465 [Bosea sp. Root483D1]|nr:hypothetical protein ASE66_18465 [Bosea sp. Root483D1]
MGFGAGTLLEFFGRLTESLDRGRMQHRVNIAGKLDDLLPLGRGEAAPAAAIEVPSKALPTVVLGWPRTARSVNAMARPRMRFVEPKSFSQ